MNGELTLKNHLKEARVEKNLSYPYGGSALSEATILPA